MYLDFGDAKAARAVAAGTPHSARATALLSMHEGDWRRAGLAAYDEAGWTSDDDYCENWLAPEAIRDYALKTGELSRAIAFIKLKYYFGDAPAAHLDVLQLPRGRLSFAAHGRCRSSRRRHWRCGVPRHRGTMPTRPSILGDSRRLRARILLLDGKPDAALAELAESFRSGILRCIGGTPSNYDPLWLPLHGDARFQAIAADVRRYVDAQRSELEALRRNGLVPRRGLPVASR